MASPKTIARRRSGAGSARYFTPARSWKPFTFATDETGKRLADAYRGWLRLLAREKRKLANEVESTLS